MGSGGVVLVSRGGPSRYRVVGCWALPCPRLGSGVLFVTRLIDWAIEKHRLFIDIDFLLKLSEVS